MRKLLVLAVVTLLGGCMTQATNPVSVSSAGQGFAAMLNRERAAGGLRPVVQDDRLARAAQLHAEDMATYGYFSHSSRNGRDLGDRVGAQGFDYCWAGENIAQGQLTEQEVLEGWMNSAGHRRNIMWGKATSFGLGHSASGNYWVLDLGEAGCS